MISDRDDLLQQLNVSRETEERLDTYVALLRKWTKRINLVSPKTVDDIWTRHIADSAQLLSFKPADASKWADLGSGGGFPGAVVAILSSEAHPNLDVSLVEADQRKAAFLRSVSRQTGVDFAVIAERIEDVGPIGADVVSARALAPLSQLLGYVDRHLKAGGTALLPKGAGWRQENASALEKWRFDCKNYPSKTDADAVILEIGEIKRV